MSYNKEHLKELQDIKQIMERSSRFISLSGWSGIAAGICGLVGAYFAHISLQKNSYYSVSTSSQNNYTYFPFFLKQLLHDRLFYIAFFTLIAAIIFTFVFTYIKSRKNKTPVWTSASRRLLLNFSIPMIVGGIFLLKLIENGNYDLIVPGCLIFYGQALISSGKYTLSGIKNLGFCEILLGVISCWFTKFGLYFWAAGFGLFNIIYGTLILFKYEKKV